MPDKLSKGDDVQYKSHSTQINLSDCTSEKDFSFYYTQHKIPEAVVYRELPQVFKGPFDLPADDPKEQYGYESVPHITVLYGLKNAEDYFEMRDQLSDFGSFEFTIGDITSFRRPEMDYDVIILDIISEQLHKLHGMIRKKFKNDYKFPDYKPHMTLAYVQKGACIQLEGPCDWTGTTYTCAKINFCHKDKYFLEIPLTK